MCCVCVEGSKHALVVNTLALDDETGLVAHFEGLCAKENY